MRQRPSERPGLTGPTGPTGPTTQGRAAERLYALLLLFYPRAHRRAFGPLMRQTFRDSYRDALATDGRTGLRFWLGVAGDEARSLIREHGTALQAQALHVKRWRVDIAAGGFLIGSAVLYIARCVHR